MLATVAMATSSIQIYLKESVCQKMGSGCSSKLAIAVAKPEGEVFGQKHSQLQIPREFDRTEISDDQYLHTVA